MTHTGRSVLDEKTINLNAPDLLLKLIEGHDIQCETHEFWSDGFYSMRHFLDLKRAAGQIANCCRIE